MINIWEMKEYFPTSSKTFHRLDINPLDRVIITLGLMLPQQRFRKGGKSRKAQ
ncbi:hypothetical protein GCM10007981_19330 [Thermocladium modestius]|uniref:Uncharacterized protein n=1 Tax=Thermocladium modestius TaxID=62609 RepID=A0A830H114_9CREN|nr:hypothetical protein GCM10007981_19330 [Thermocladium modestius]